MGRLGTVLLKDGTVTTMNLSKAKAIKHRCFVCSDFSTKQVKECSHDNCQLFPYRRGKNPYDGRTRSQAIRNHCIWCSGNEPKMVRYCSSDTCPLYSHRTGAEKQKIKKEKRIKREVRIKRYAIV